MGRGKVQFCNKTMLGFSPETGGHEGVEPQLNDESRMLPARTSIPSKTILQNQAGMPAVCNPRVLEADMGKMFH